MKKSLLACLVASAGLAACGGSGDDGAAAAAAAAAAASAAAANAKDPLTYIDETKMVSSAEAKEWLVTKDNLGPTYAGLGEVRRLHRLPRAEDARDRDGGLHPLHVPVSLLGDDRMARQVGLVAHLGRHQDRRRLVRDQLRQYRRHGRDRPDDRLRPDAAGRAAADCGADEGQDRRHQASGVLDAVDAHYRQLAL